MSIVHPILFAATALALVAASMSGARAVWEVEGRLAVSAGPRAVALTCASGLTDVQARACENAALRWGLCQRVYVSRPDADDAFYACFEAAP